MALVGTGGGGNTGTPSTAAAAGVDTLTLNGNDSRGTIRFQSTLGVGIGDLCTITFSAAQTVAPIVQLSIQTSGIITQLTCPTTTTTFVVNCAARTGFLTDFTVGYKVFGGP